MVLWHLAYALFFCLCVYAFLEHVITDKDDDQEGQRGVLAEAFNFTQDGLQNTDTCPVCIFGLLSTFALVQTTSVNHIMALLMDSFTTSLLAHDAHCQ